MEHAGLTLIAQQLIAQLSQAIDHLDAAYRLTAAGTKKS
jgi:hypothetical protein